MFCERVSGHVSEALIANYFWCGVSGGMFLGYVSSNRTSALLIRPRPHKIPHARRTMKGKCAFPSAQRLAALQHVIRVHRGPCAFCKHGKAG